MQVLELQFLREDGKVTTLTVDQPNMPIDKVAVSAVMDKVLASGIFRVLGQNSRKKGIRLVDRAVTDIDLK